MKNTAFYSDWIDFPTGATMKVLLFDGKPEMKLGNTPCRVSVGVVSKTDELLVEIKSVGE